MKTSKPRKKQRHKNTQARKVGKHVKRVGM